MHGPDTNVSSKTYFLRLSNTLHTPLIPSISVFFLLPPSTPTSLFGRDETTRIPLRKIAKSCTPDADDRVTLQHFSDQFLSFMRPPKPSEAFAMKTNIRVDQLFDAMDLNSDEQVSKIEFIEFLRSNKPKDGSFNSVARLTEAFNFHRRDVINRDDFHDVFQKLKKELKAEDFQYAFPADDE